MRNKRGETLCVARSGQKVGQKMIGGRFENTWGQGFGDFGNLGKNWVRII